MFKTRYTRSEFKTKGDPTGGPKLVETAGYISAKQRIENLILAGQRLDEYRYQMYDDDGEKFDEDNTFIDPTRSSNYDLADAFQDAVKVQSRLKEQSVKVKEKEKNSKKEEKISEPVREKSELPKDLEK